MDLANQPLVQPATATLNVRDFPLDLKHAVERVKFEHNQQHPANPVTLSGVLAEAVRFWLQHGGHLEPPAAEEQG